MKRIIPGPLLLITAIILDRIVVSTTQIDVWQSTRLVLVMLGCVIVATFVIQQFIKDWHRTDFLVLVVLEMLLVYRSLYGWFKIILPSLADHLALALLPILLLLYFVIVSGSVWRSISDPVRFTSYSNLVFSLLLIFQAVRLVDSLYSRPTLRSSATITFEKDLQLSTFNRPDIYVIVLDGYARQDVLSDIYEHDNSEFVGGLEQRGFHVATENHSNYVQTPYSMASFWNFDYLPIWEASHEYEQYLYQPIQENRVFRSLDAIGYTTVSTEAGIHFAEIRKSDVYLSDFLPLNDFETFFLIDSPLEPVSNLIDLGLPIHTYKTHRQRIHYQLETLKKIPADIQGPRIVYTHILAPHPPFVFDEHGDIHDFEQAFTLAEGTEFHGGQDEYVNGYREQVKFINVEVMKVIDAILSTSEMPPIIVVMGDHGPSSQFNFNLEDPGCVWERTSNLYAILLPGHQNDGTLYPSISPVNTFRVIFNAYFGTDLRLLEDRSYLRSWQQPTRNVDVTDIRDSRSACTNSGDESLATK